MAVTSCRLLQFRNVFTISGLIRMPPPRLSTIPHFIFIFFPFLPSFVGKGRRGGGNLSSVYYLEIPLSNILFNWGKLFALL